jgi:hypothetical protein
MDNQQLYQRYLESTCMMVNPPSFYSWMQNQPEFKGKLGPGLHELMRRWGHFPEVSGKVNG